MNKLVSRGHSTFSVHMHEKHLNTCLQYVTEAGSGVVSEQRNRLVATIKFIYAGIQKKDDCKQNPE